MCDPVSIGVASLVAGGVGTVMQMQQAKKANATAKQAGEQATQNAKDALTQQEQDMNARNTKQPNIAALSTANSAAATQGNTLLSGPQGVDPASLQLGKNILLGR